MRLYKDCPVCELCGVNDGILVVMTKDRALPNMSICPDCIIPREEAEKVEKESES